MSETEQKKELVAPKSREKLGEAAWRLNNPLELTSERLRDVHALMQAHIDILDTNHFVHVDIPALIKWRIPYHTVIYVPLKGAIEWQSDAQTQRVEPGQIVFIGIEQPHAANSLSRHFEVVSVHANIRLGASVPNQPLFNDMVQTLPHVDYWHQQMEFLASLRNDEGAESLCNDVVRQLLIDLVLQGVELTSHKKHIDPRVEQAMELIREHVANPMVLDITSRAIKISAGRLRLLFQREIGVSPKAYHQTVRLQEVIRLLGQRELSIKEIAGDLGYTNPQHLDKNFKAAYGMSPGQYRETM